MFGLLQVGQTKVLPATAGEALKAPVSAATTEQEALDAYGKLPAIFVENAGQADARVRYYAQGAGYGFAFARNEAILSFVKGNRGAALALRFLGARQAEPEGARQLAGKVNYLVGNDPAKWQTGLPTYGEVRYRNLWPGVDMVFRGGTGRLKYEFVVRPGARAPDIRLAYRGAERLSLDPRGNLLIRTSLGVLTDTRPLSYQVIGGKRVLVKSRFVVGRAGAYGFLVGRYDARRPLVIDPGLLYSTYLGGSTLFGDDQGLGIAVDAAGNAYVAGSTGSTNFPTTAGAFDTGFNGGFNIIADAFVTKLNPTGSALVYSTYLGGEREEAGQGIALDSAGNAYVTGLTNSANFPTTLGAFDTGFDGSSGGGSDAFVTKLNAAGTGLVYSTFLGGTATAEDAGHAIALDSAGNAYVTGLTNSVSFPTTLAAFDTMFNGLYDAFVTKLNAAGSGLVYSTFLGAGPNDDVGFGIAIDVVGGAYVTGTTQSANFPTTPGAFDTSFNGAFSSYDAFVTKLNSTGSALVYSTFLGGSGSAFLRFSEAGLGIAPDAMGNAYVTGRTESADFPTTTGAFDTGFGGGGFDGFVTKLNAAGSGLVYSTYLGGGGDDRSHGIALNAAGGANVTGRTASPGFPTTAGAFDTTFNGGGSDAFVTKFDPSGSGLAYSTYLGGSGSFGDGDQGFGIALDPAGRAYVTGRTASGDFPTTTGAFDTTFNDILDAFVTVLDLGGTPATLTLSPAADTNPVGTPHTVTATVEDAGGNPVSGVTVRFSVTGANGASGADVTDANGQATFTYTGTVAGLDTISAFADTDNDGIQDLGEPGGAATKTWTPGAPATLTLAPPAATNTVGTTHCVTATVKDAFGNPVPGVTVRFSVPTAVATHASPPSGSATTDAGGQATFCFAASLPGVDAIHAFADADNDATQDAGEPFGDATKTWILPPSTAFCEVRITQGGWIIANNGDRASFGGNAKVLADDSVKGQENYRDHGPLQPRQVHAIELTAVTCSDDLTMAAIFGRATIDGAGTYVFRIDVIDQGEPGKNDSYGIILSDGYASGQQRLQGGNVQIHK